MSDKEITIRTTHPYSIYDDKKYMSHWEWKKQIYAGIEYSEEKGNLIVSRDELNGGINSEKIDEIVKKISM